MPKTSTQFNTLSLPLVDGKCPICTKTPENGYCRVVRGEVVETCIHDCHADHIAKPSGRWSFYKQGRREFKACIK